MNQENWTLLERLCFLRDEWDIGLKFSAREILEDIITDLEKVEEKKKTKKHVGMA